MVAITALNVIFWVDVLDYMKHVDSNGVIDPAYESPTTIAVVITFLISVLALIFFIVDLIYYFNVKKRMKNKNNNIEISVKSDDQKLNTALDTAQAKFMTAGLVADLNKQTEIDAEYSYKLKRVVNNKETFCLFFYTLYKPFGITILAAILMCVGLNMLFNINNPQEAIIPSIISASAAILSTLTLTKRKHFKPLKKWALEFILITLNNITSSQKVIQKQKLDIKFHFLK